MIEIRRFVGTVWRLASARQALLALGILVLVMLCAGAVPILSGRTTPPVYSRDSAGRAVDRARAVGAARWAPKLLSESETGLRSSLLEERRQDLRFLTFRDYDAARDGFRLAETVALRAVRESQRAREQARSAARDALDQARQLVDEVDASTDSLQLGRSERVLLRTALLHVHEAERLWDEEAYAKAQARAEQSRIEARRVRARVATIAARYNDRDQLAHWQRWMDETVVWSRRNNEAAIIVNKEKNQLMLYVGGRPVETYRADMGSNNLSVKLRSGDAATPEGRYRIIGKKGRGQSRYYKALELDYPNDEDRRRFAEAKRRGLVPRNASPGGLIEIHGEGGRREDWTRGCVALSNTDLDRVFARVRVGTPVTIVGGDGRGGAISELARKFSSAGTSEP